MELGNFRPLGPELSNLRPLGPELNWATSVLVAVGVSVVLTVLAVGDILLTEVVVVEAVVVMVVVVPIKTGILTTLISFT